MTEEPRKHLAMASRRNQKSPAFDRWQGQEGIIPSVGINMCAYAGENR